MIKVVAKEYTLQKKLGSGAFGQVFRAIHSKNKTEVAVKLEPANSKSPQLFFEAKILSIISNQQNKADMGIPNVYYCGAEGEYNIMVMDLLGDSLEDLFVMSGKKFDLKTTLQLAYQMVERIQLVQKKGFIHRDMKPDNFMMGQGKNCKKLYLIDFGLAKRFQVKQGSHIMYRDNKNLTGTARYASLNTHLGIQQSRRDDLQGMLHVLLYFIRGNLPWQDLRAANKKQKYEKILDKKLSIPVEKLCQGLIPEFREMLVYVRNLEFEDQPDYQWMKNIIKGAMDRQEIQMDGRYCWKRD